MCPGRKLEKANRIYMGMKSIMHVDKSHCISTLCTKTTHQKVFREKKRSPEALIMCFVRYSQYTRNCIQRDMHFVLLFAHTHSFLTLLELRRRLVPSENKEEGRP